MEELSSSLVGTGGRELGQAAPGGGGSCRRVLCVTKGSGPKLRGHGAVRQHLPGSEWRVPLTESPSPETLPMATSPQPHRWALELLDLFWQEKTRARNSPGWAGRAEQGQPCVKWRPGRGWPGDSSLQGPWLQVGEQWRHSQCQLGDGEGQGPTCFRESRGFQRGGSPRGRRRESSAGPRASPQQHLPAAWLPATRPTGWLERPTHGWWGGLWPWHPWLC